MLYKKIQYSYGTIKKVADKIAESLEKTLQRMIANKEPLEGMTPLIYQERQDGIQAAYNIRTDRFDVALDAMEAIEKSNTAKREMKMGEKTFDTMTPEQQTEFKTKYPQAKVNPGSITGGEGGQK